MMKVVVSSQYEKLSDFLFKFFQEDGQCISAFSSVHPIILYTVFLLVLYFTNFRKIVKLKPRKIYSLLHNQVNDVTITCISY